MNISPPSNIFFSICVYMYVCLSVCMLNSFVSNSKDDEVDFDTGKYKCDKYGYIL